MPPIESLGTLHQRTTFSCGIDALDRYLARQAGQDVAKRVAAVFVLAEPPSPDVLGFYTLAATSVQLLDLPTGVAKRLPKYPHVPATLLGRLAVDRRAGGHGFGALLLADALARSLGAVRTVASAAVVVDAKNDSAQRFYAHHGFIPLPDSPSRLFLPMQTIETLHKV